MSTTQICVSCESDYSEVGRAYKRNNSSKIDYRCTHCGSKRKPIDCITVEEQMEEDFSYYKTKVNATYVGDDVMRNVLVVGDLHLPFSKKGYLEFCQEMYTKHNCTDVVFIGDIIDNHYSSFHDTDPDGHGAGDEIDRAYKELAKWKKAFPIAKVCLGNHDAIPNRKAFNAGLSKRWVRSIEEVFDLDGWEFAEEFEIDGVVYTHGIGSKAYKKAVDDMCSYVCGHWHTELTVQFKVGRHIKIFGVQAGCGVDIKSYAMAYGKHFKKPAIGCALIKENGKVALVESMNMG